MVGASSRRLSEPSAIVLKRSTSSAL